MALTRYYRKFIQNYGVIAALLTTLLKKDAFHWSPQAKQAFVALKQAISNPPVLTLPDFSKTFIVECDVSGLGQWSCFDVGSKAFGFPQPSL